MRRKGWLGEPLRHSNARKLGRAGPAYRKANKNKILTGAKHTIDMALDSQLATQKSRVEDLEYKYERVTGDEETLEELRDARKSVRELKEARKLLRQ